MQIGKCIKQIGKYSEINFIMSPSRYLPIEIMASELSFMGGGGTCVLVYFKWWLCA